jgi:hypothetical protein
MKIEFSSIFHKVGIFRIFHYKKFPLCSLIIKTLMKIAEIGEITTKIFSFKNGTYYCAAYNFRFPGAN